MPGTEVMANFVGNHQRGDGVAVKCIGNTGCIASGTAERANPSHPGGATIEVPATDKVENGPVTFQKIKGTSIAFVADIREQIFRYCCFAEHIVLGIIEKRQ